MTTGLSVVVTLFAERIVDDRLMKWAKGVIALCKSERNQTWTAERITGREGVVQTAWLYRSGPYVARIPPHIRSQLSPPWRVRVPSQKCLGHPTLEMTRRYANLMTEDLQAVHGGSVCCHARHSSFLHLRHIDLRGDVDGSELFFPVLDRISQNLHEHLCFRWCHGNADPVFDHPLTLPSGNLANHERNIQGRESRMDMVRVNIPKIRPLHSSGFWLWLCRLRSSYSRTVFLFGHRQ